jgi:hypothetical protein
MKPVRYALLQQTLELPALESLRRAFESVRCLVAADAPGVANDAFGILVRDLELADAQRLQSALQTEGIQTELVPMPALPAMPPTRFVRRIEFGAQALLIYDPIGRPVPIEWRHLILLAAGRVRGELTLDLMLTEGVTRFSLLADGANPVLFRSLGADQDPEVTTNFTRLVGRLADRAPQAMLNRGAWSLRQSPPVWFDYPSKNAFFEEILWMLHRLRQARGRNP